MWTRTFGSYGWCTYDYGEQVVLPRERMELASSKVDHFALSCLVASSTFFSVDGSSSSSSDRSSLTVAPETALTHQRLDASHAESASIWTHRHKILMIRKVQNRLINSSNRIGAKIWYRIQGGMYCLSGKGLKICRFFSGMRYHSYHTLRRIRKFW